MYTTKKKYGIYIPLILSHHVHTDQPRLQSKVSRKTSAGNKANKAYKLYNANKARAFIKCSACSKPRVIYVPNESASLTKEERHAIKMIEEAGEYVCGAEMTQYKVSRIFRREPPLAARSSLQRLKGRELCKTKSSSFI